MNVPSGTTSHRLAAALAEKRPAIRWRMAQAWSALLYPKAFASFGAGSVIVAPSRLRNCGRISVGSKCAIYEGVWLQAERADSWIQLGDRNYFGQRVHVHALGSVVVGSDCVFTDHVLVSDGEHVPGQLNQVVSRGDINIGDGVFIGVGAAILGGVTIGHGAVIGANSVVTRDVPAGAVVAGAPALVIRQLEQVPTGP